MFRRVISTMLTLVLLTPAVLSVGQKVVAGNRDSALQKTVQEQVLEISPGTLVEVRLDHKQKVRGRMGETAEDGFTLQYVQGDRLATRKITFAEIKSIKTVDGKLGAGTRVLAAFGGVILVLTIIGLIVSGGRA